MRYCVLFHTVVILTGIMLIHLPNGWFVVGHGAGGIEYSVLILAVLCFVYAASGEEHAIGSGGATRAMQEGAHQG